MSPGKVYGLLQSSKGRWPELRFTLLVSALKRNEWGFCLSGSPFAVFSSSTAFSLGVNMTLKPPLIMAYLIPNGQLRRFCILPIYPFYFSFRQFYLLLSLFFLFVFFLFFFSHKYSLSALDTSFCCQSHTFCPFSQ